MSEDIQKIAEGLDERQCKVILRGAHGRLSTVEALSLPMVGLVQRTGGYNRWGLTQLGHDVRQQVHAYLQGNQS